MHQDEPQDLDPNPATDPVRIETQAPKLLGIVGSPHGRGGATYRLVEAVANAAEMEGATTRILHLDQYAIGYCTACWTCLEKGECSQNDDMSELRRMMLASDLLVWGSPTYFGTVTAQMKTFIDRLLPFGHRPPLTGKYAVAVSPSAGAWETDTARYMARVLDLLGAQVVGEVAAIFSRASYKDQVPFAQEQAQRMGKELVQAWREGRQYPLTWEKLHFQRFMGQLIWESRDFMKADLAYWTEKGWMKEEGGAQPYSKTQRLR